MPPPKGAGKSSYLTAVTEVDQELIEILDVEKILHEITPMSAEVSAEIIDEPLEKDLSDNHEKMCVRNHDFSLEITILNYSVICRKSPL